MGVRISVYGIDLPRLAVVLEQPLRALDLPQRFPRLQQPARQFLSESSNYHAHWLLEALSLRDGVNVARCLIDGERRWWIGSLLQAAKALYDPERCSQLVDLFHKILRGLDCGYPMPPLDASVDAQGLPWTPHEDPDLRMGRWTQADLSLACVILPDVLASTPTFRPTPYFGIAPSDSDWSPWVSANAKALTGDWLFGFEEPNIVTFIG